MRETPSLFLYDSSGMTASRWSKPPTAPSATSHGAPAPLGVLKPTISMVSLPPSGRFHVVNRTISFSAERTPGHFAHLVDPAFRQNGADIEVRRAPPTHPEVGARVIDDVVSGSFGKANKQTQLNGHQYEGKDNAGKSHGEPVPGTAEHSARLMVGYFNRPEETRQAIDADGYMHTGDVAIQDEDGYLRLVDRTKDMINIGGFTVFSRKVEDVLNRHPAVNISAIIGSNNPERSGSELVNAYDPESRLPCHRRYGILKKAITDFAREKLAPYEVPKILEIRKELPLTNVGKIDKRF